MATASILLLLCMTSASVSAFLLVRVCVSRFYEMRDALRADGAEGLRSRAVAVAGGLAGFRVFAFIERAKEQKRRQQLRSAMPEALRSLCMALDAGNSLVRALEHAADSCSEPMAGELKRAVWDLDAGQGFDEAMEHLRTRTGGSEFAYLAVAMEIQHRTGGSMNEVLQSVSQSLQQAAQLEEELRTKTTQARLSARVVAVMPLALLAIITLLSPGYFAQFFSNAFGVVMFCMAVLLECVGVLLVRHMLSVDLGGGMQEAA